MRRLLAQRPSPAMAVALVALFVSLGGVSYGAAVVITSKQIKNNTVATKDLKNNDIRSGDIRNNSLTGGDVNESTFGKVPSAAAADSATTAASADNAANAATAQNAVQLGGTAASGYARNTYEAVHLVGSPGEPAFTAGWGNFGLSYAPVGFYKDSVGLVHLQGLASSGAAAIAFTLPEGYRPSTKHYQVVASGDADGVAHITIAENGTINLFDYTAGNLISFEFIVFKPGT